MVALTRSARMERAARLQQPEPSRGRTGTVAVATTGETADISDFDLSSSPPEPVTQALRRRLPALNGSDALNQLADRLFKRGGGRLALTEAERALVTSSQTEAMLQARLSCARLTPSLVQVAKASADPVALTLAQSVHARYGAVATQAHAQLAEMARLRAAPPGATELLPGPGNTPRATLGGNLPEGWERLDGDLQRLGRVQARLQTRMSARDEALTETAKALLEARERGPARGAIQVGEFVHRAAALGALRETAQRFQAMQSFVPGAYEEALVPGLAALEGMQKTARTASLWSEDPLLARACADVARCTASLGAALVEQLSPLAGDTHAVEVSARGQKRSLPAARGPLVTPEKNRFAPAAAMEALIASHTNEALEALARCLALPESADDLGAKQVIAEMRAARACAPQIAARLQGVLSRSQALQETQVAGSEADRTAIAQLPRLALECERLYAQRAGRGDAFAVFMAQMDVLELRLEGLHMRALLASPQQELIFFARDMRRDLLESLARAAMAEAQAQAQAPAQR